MRRILAALLTASFARLRVARRGSGIVGAAVAGSASGGGARPQRPSRGPGSGRDAPRRSAAQGPAGPRHLPGWKGLASGHRVLPRSGRIRREPSAPGAFLGHAGLRRAGSDARGWSGKEGRGSRPRAPRARGRRRRGPQGLGEPCSRRRLPSRRVRRGRHENPRPLGPARRDAGRRRRPVLRGLHRGAPGGRDRRHSERREGEELRRLAASRVSADLAPGKGTAGSDREVLGLGHASADGHHRARATGGSRARTRPGGSTPTACRRRARSSACWLEGASHRSFSGRAAEPGAALPREKGKGAVSAEGEVALFQQVRIASLAFWDAFLRGDSAREGVPGVGRAVERERGKGEAREKIGGV